MQESLRKNCPILGKAYMFKGEVTFMRVRVWFAFWRIVILTIRAGDRGFDQRISGTRRARGMSEDGAGIRTRPSANTRSNITVLL